MLEMADITKIMFKDDVNLFYLYKMMRSLHINGSKKSVNHLKPFSHVLNQKTLLSCSQSFFTTFANEVMTEKM